MPNGALDLGARTSSAETFSGAFDADCERVTGYAEPGHLTELPNGRLRPYGSGCSMWYCFNLRYRVVLPMPSMRAVESLSPPVSRRVRRMARRSNSSSGRISSFSGPLSVDGYFRLEGRAA